MNIKRIIREMVGEVVMSEGAKTFFEIGPNVGLVITKSTTDQAWLNLFDFAEKNV